jgi:hypothetical protein
MKLIDEALLDQARSKALARRRSNRGASVLLPSQAELVSPLIGVGGDLNSPARYRQRTILGRVGAKLVDRHRKRDRSGSSSLNVRRLGAVLRKTIFDIYAAMPSSWNTPRMAARSAS